MADDLEEALDRLYAVPLDDFVAERKAIAAELRKAGRREAAALVARATKPNVSAWAVNQLARRNRPGVEDLLGAGERLVREQADALRGGGAAFEEAQRDERAAVRRLVDAAAKILDLAGRPAGAGVRERVAATLRAAAVDEEGRELLAKGRLTRDLEPLGFDPLAAMAATVHGAGKKRPARARETAPRRTDDGGDRVERAREALTAARARARELDRAARDANREARTAEQAAREAEKEAERARRAAAQARERADAARAAAVAARSDVARANAAFAAARG